MISEAEARAITAREVDLILLPRNMGPPSPEYVERAELVRASWSDSGAENVDPPGYSTYGGRESVPRTESERYSEAGVVPLRYH